MDTNIVTAPKELVSKLKIGIYKELCKNGLITKEQLAVLLLIQQKNCPKPIYNGDMHNYTDI